MTSAFEISQSEAVAPLVLALDVGSTASRGMMYDAHGRPVGRRAKVAHAFTVAPDGTSVIDPDQVVDEIRTIIDSLTEQFGDTPIAGVGLDTFASSLIVVDEAGAALTPCFTYADSRCGRQVSVLREELVEAQVQQRTGARIHSSYWPARLRWLAQDQPEVVAGAAHYLSLGDYVLRALTGVLATGTSTAAWTGLVDRQTATWSAPDLQAAGVRVEQLPPIHHLDQPLELSAEGRDAVAQRWPTLAEASWFATVSDGFAANVGLGAHDATMIGGSCATSGALRVLVRDLPEQLPPGLWCYRVSHDRALIGGALNDVGRALSWAEEVLRTPGDAESKTKAGSEASREEQADGEAPATGADLTSVLTAEPTERTPLVLPFLTGERSSTLR